MTYKQTIDFLFSSLPMYQRIGDSAIKKDLTNIKKLCVLLNNPQLSFPSIHIAGTNGKGSTSHMLASIFQAAGKRVGLYTSPHYVDFRERIKVNGEMISEKNVVKFVEACKKDWKGIQPSFFEITVAMAFDHFRNKKIDIAIIETGLGGRLDSTNIITPLLSIITNIGYDHMQMLGDTLAQIASEKAGIIKNNTPVIIGEWHRETSQVFKNKAALEHALLYFASKHIHTRKLKANFMKQEFFVKTRSQDWLGKIITDLAGPYQEKNIRTVLEACWVWNQHYKNQKLSDNVIRSGLKNVRSSTNMIGRWMLLKQKPTVITDAAHNIDGIKNILPALLKIKAKQRHFVLGFVSDKDVTKILALFPPDALYYWCSPDIPRGKPSLDTKRVGDTLGLKGEAYESVFQAYRQALSAASKQGLIFVGGSSYVVGDLLASLK